MYVIVIGGGRTGSHLASLLIAQGHEVCVVEHRHEVLASIHHELPTEIIYEGDGTDPQILETVDIKRRVNNPRNAWLFTPEFGVDVALNQADIIAKLIEEEMSLGDMIIMLKLRRGKFSLVEEKIFPGAQAIGIAVKDLKLPPNCIISGIIRHGEIVIPRGVTTLEEGDEILALVDDSAREQLAKILGRPEEVLMN